MSIRRRAPIEAALWPVRAEPSSRGPNGMGELKAFGCQSWCDACGLHDPGEMGIRCLARWRGDGESANFENL